MEGYFQHNKELMRFIASHRYQSTYITSEMSPSPHIEGVNILTWNTPLWYAQTKLKSKHWQSKLRLNILLHSKIPSIVVVANFLWIIGYWSMLYLPEAHSLSTEMYSDPASWNWLLSQNTVFINASILAERMSLW